MITPELLAKLRLENVNVLARVDQLRVRVETEGTSALAHEVAMLRRELRDYVGLVAAGSSVLSLLPVVSGDTNNRTDIYFAATSIARAAGDGPLQLRGYGAIEAPKGSASAAFRQAVTDQIARSLGDKMTIRPPRERER